MRTLFDAVPDQTVPRALFEPRYNIRPTQQILMVRPSLSGGREIVAARWGFLPHWYKSESGGPLLINARSETLHEKPAFRDACRARRCLIPADGFYEWQGAGTPARKPYWIAPYDEAPLVLGGIWQEWQGKPTVAIVTTAANESLSPLHDRLPLAVAPQDFALWLGEAGHGAARLMRVPEEAFYRFHRIGAEINRGGREAPDHAGLRTPLSEAALAKEAEVAATQDAVPGTKGVPPATDDIPEQGRLL